MRRLLPFVLLAVPFAAQAQPARPFAEKGDFALVVGISGLTFSDITPALGGIGVRYRVTDRSVIGTSIGFDVGTADRDDSGDTRTSGSARLALWNETHIGRGRGIVSPFVGGGVVADIRHATFRVDATPCDPAACPGPPLSAEQRQTGFSVGVGALLGAEVRIARGVTLGAAYTLGVVVGRDRYDSDLPGAGQDRFATTSVLGGTGLTDLNLSVYF